MQQLNANMSHSRRINELIYSVFSWGRRGNAEASVWALRQTISLTSRILNQEDPELSLATLRQAEDALDEVIGETRDLIRWTQPPSGPE